MKKLRFSATVTAILGILAVIALVFLFLALSRLAENEAAFRLEWYMAGICLIVLTAFTISVFVTLGYLLKTSDRLINLTTDTGINK